MTPVALACMGIGLIAVWWGAMVAAGQGRTCLVLFADLVMFLALYALFLT